MQRPYQVGERLFITQDLRKISNDTQSVGAVMRKSCYSYLIRHDIRITPLSQVYLVSSHLPDPTPYTLHPKNTTDN